MNKDDVKTVCEALIECCIRIDPAHIDRDLYGIVSLWESRVNETTHP